jgi:hypothetical protein
MKIFTFFIPLLLLVSCAIPQSGNQSSLSPGAFLRHGDIVLDLKANKAIYQHGEPITISLKSSRRATVRIFNEDATGARTQVWPNTYSGKSDVIESESLLVIPTKGSGFALKAGAPYGINTIIAVASSAPFRAAISSNNFFVNHSTSTDFARKGISWSPIAVTGNATAQTGEARFLYEVKQP